MKMIGHFLTTTSNDLKTKDSGPVGKKKKPQRKWRPTMRSTLGNDYPGSDHQKILLKENTVKQGNKDD